MRVVSMVPSWTETLIASDVNVVGRTRFCIHPADKVKSIPIVGGTKDWLLAKLNSLNADMLILDQDENPRFMSQESGVPHFSSQICSVENVSKTLVSMSKFLKSDPLLTFARRWDQVISHCNNAKPVVTDTVPALLEWGLKPREPPQKIVYLIWRQPWMAASRQTFIGSLLALLGVEIESFDQPYPEIDVNSYSPADTMLLFSSEPYPFLKKKAELAKLKIPHAFVDGEKLSWFGLRSLQYLESIVKKI